MSARRADVRGPFTIRRAKPQDAAAILALEAHFPSDRMSSASVRRFLRLPTAHVRVARDALGEVRAALILLTRSNSRIARIYSVVVSPAARGQGLAQRLVRAAERDAASAGCEAVSLEVREDNAAARGLYEKLGYTGIVRLPAYYDDGAPGLRLRRALRPKK